MQASYEIVFRHPESFLSCNEGMEVLQSELYRSTVKAVIVSLNGERFSETFLITLHKLLTKNSDVNLNLHKLIYIFTLYLIWIKLYPKSRTRLKTG